MTAVAAESAEKELARRGLADFCRRMDRNYVVARHVEYLCGVLEAMERGELRHLIVLVPPRHGKTRLVSQFLPAWWLGRHPMDELILASNTSDLAEDNSAKTRDLVSDERYPFDARVHPDTSAKGLWRTTTGAVTRAAGVGSSIQGRGGNLLICDDPIASAEEATDTAFRRQWNWFTQDFFPRRLSDSHVILSMFRWGDKDLAGQILTHEDEEFRKDWRVVSLPAYAVDGDALGRAEGEVLWPPSITPNGRKVGYDRDFLETQRRMSSQSWAAQYCLDPVPAGGAVFRREWLQNRYRELPSGLSKGVIYIDGAFKTGVKNDRSALACWVKGGGNYYLADVIAGRWEFSDLRARVLGFYGKHREIAPVLHLCVEDAASGQSLAQEIRRTTDVPIVSVKVNASKLVRAEAVTPLFESGKVFLPESAPWLNDWLDEHLRFPAGKHDDLVDTTSGALERLRKGAAVELSWAFVSP
jgi:predicted phage terminase large subunit-like protein